jgi:hypothetical protein
MSASSRSGVLVLQPEELEVEGVLHLFVRLHRISRLLESALLEHRDLVSRECRPLEDITKFGQALSHTLEDSRELGLRLARPSARARVRSDGVVAVLVTDGGSGRVLSQILEPSGYVAQEAHEHIHRGGLSVTTRLPSRERVLSEPEQARHLRLREVEALA